MKNNLEKEAEGMFYLSLFGILAVMLLHIFIFSIIEKGDSLTVFIACISLVLWVSVFIFMTLLAFDNYKEERDRRIENDNKIY